ncbi:MAG: sigma-70 family RNA polymerase sigma factor [Phenylobacterium sp.]|uniref:RNA polymerase sigma factor n=1 Tax=Phenylobacterium sp. TaxID=1871053 RepID=UPI0025D6CBF7|nr:RNA polymerase sigma factor [Phenylobacterium sp.]MBI1199536.1 sigma-70 family RNA polymerase sigma factor [Phenylobacterium sp.]
MGAVSDERAVWLARHALPAEPALRAWLARQPRFHLEVDDIVQETYAVLAGLERVDHIVNPRTYMFQVAKTVILQALRRRRVIAFETLAAADSLEIPDDQPGADVVLADRQELGRVAALIAALPAKCREAFTLRKVLGLSQKEVAARMGLSESTVEKHIGRGLRQVMNAMGRGGSGRIAASRKRGARTEPPAEDARARSRD